MNHELVIHYRQNIIRQGVFGACFMIGILYLLYITPLENPYPFLEGCIPFFKECFFLLRIIVKGFLMSCLLALLLSIAYYMINLRKNPVIMILNKEGVWIQYHGWISWNNIEEIFIYRISTTPMEGIAIDFCNPLLVSKQSSFLGKIRLFWPRIFKYPHVILTNLDIENEVIISFSRRFKNNK